MVIKNKISRPKYSKNKEIEIGMRIFLTEGGTMEARHRAKKGCRLIGYVVGQSGSHSNIAVKGNFRAV